jgi:hypothetical protein
MCETSLDVPQPGTPPPFLVEDLVDALDRYKISDFDRACAKRALDLGLVPTAKIGSAIAKLRGEMLRGRSPTLLAILRKYGRIDEQGERKIRSGIDVSEPSAASSRKSGKAKRLHSDSLHILKQTVVLDVAAFELAKGPVPAVPGPALNRCPTCGRTLKAEAASAGKCPACAADVCGLVPAPSGGGFFRGALAWFGGNWLALLGVAAAVTLAWAGLNWSRVRRQGAALLKGETRAALEERVRKFDRALEFGDLETLSKMLATSPRDGVTNELRAFILSGQTPPPPIEKVRSIEHPEIELDEQAGRATVFTRVRAKLDLAKVKTPDVETSGDVAAAGRAVIGSAGGLSTEIAWKWVLQGDMWRYAGPLPTSSE